MPVSLGRKIRRLKLDDNTVAVGELRQTHKRNRLLARDKQQTPAKEHRRSKSRRKITSEPAKGYPTAGNHKGKK